MRLGFTYLSNDQRTKVMQKNAQPRQTETARLSKNMDFRHLLEVMPAAAYTTDAEGLITQFNQRAVGLWGREPRLNDPIDRY